MDELEFPRLVEGTPAQVQRRGTRLRLKAALDVALMLVAAGLAAVLSQRSGDPSVWGIAVVAWLALAVKLAHHTGRVCAGACPQCEAPQEVPLSGRVFCCTSCFGEFVRVQIPGAGEMRFKPWRLAR